jgi:uncharacterized protein (DUF58 family)
MLTVRSSFLLCLSIFGMAFGILQQREFVALLCLAVVIWVWLQWLAFERFRRSIKKFQASMVRTINQHRQDRVSLVAERWYDVDVEFDLARLKPGYRITLQDCVPDGFALEGHAFTVFESTDDKAFLSLSFKQTPRVARLGYRISSPICGKFSFAGIKLEIADTVGFFRYQFFVPLHQTVTLLPYLIRPQTTVSILKHNNLQKHLGHHRHRSSGISSELHGIRDYRAGDPPRSIAWKATGKLGRLMTSEYENEVPIRATMLVDLAGYQFEGRPAATAGDRAISTAASIAKLLLADRDPVAALLINDHKTSLIKHGSGERHLTKLLQHLIDASKPSAPLSSFVFADLIQVIFEHATQRFAPLMDEKFNHGKQPWSFPWLFPSEADYFRRPLAILFEHLFDLPCGSATRLQYDEVWMRRLCLRYATEYSVDSASTTLAIDPPYQDMGSWLNVRNRIWLELSEQLNQLRARARENELFVIISPEPYDLLGCEMMETAIKTTIAAKHRVIFVAPEAPSFPDQISDPIAAEIFARNRRASFRNADSEMGDRLGQLGVAFARIDDPRLMQLVSAEIGILQSGSRRAGGGNVRARS